MWPEEWVRARSPTLRPWTVEALNSDVAWGPAWLLRAERANMVTQWPLKGMIHKWRELLSAMPMDALLNSYRIRNLIKIITLDNLQVE